MDGYTLTACLLSLAVLIAYFNERFTRLQTSSVVMAAGLLISLGLLLLAHTTWPSLKPDLSRILMHIDFQHFLLQGVLSFLLFAGALQLQLRDIRKNWIPITCLALPGTLLSTLLIGAMTWYLQPVFHLHLHLYTCFLFGAVISPTDPIAVLATFKQLGAPKDLSTTVAGESLFNDGIGIVIFLTILASLHAGSWVGPWFFCKTFFHEAVGGLVYGVVLGFMAQRMISRANNERMVLMLTVMVVMGGYSLADYWGISGPLAMVICGLMIDWEKHQPTFSTTTGSAVDTFWHTIDELLNTVLFLLLGLELLAIPFKIHTLLLMLGFIPLSLLARWVSVTITTAPLKWMRRWPYSSAAMTWYGLRGGLAVALALSVPAGFGRTTILTMTYGVVVFAILVQAMSIQYYFTRHPHAG